MARDRVVNLVGITRNDTHTKKRTQHITKSITQHLHTLISWREFNHKFIQAQDFAAYSPYQPQVLRNISTESERVNVNRGEERGCTVTDEH